MSHAPRRFAFLTVSALGLVLLAAQPVHADGRIWGYARVERIKGQPDAGYKYLYETNVYLTPKDATSLGASRRVGAPPQSEPASPDANAQSGYFSFTVPAGDYSLLLNQPDFFLRPKVVPDITVTDDEDVFVTVDVPIEYSTYVEDLEWTGSEGDVWYQTFTAVGTSVTGASFRIANEQDNAIEVAILESDGTEIPTNWPVLGSGVVENPGMLGDNWVRWRSGEINLTPGTQYAVRLTGGALQPLKRDKDDLSYAHGRAYNKAGDPKDFDIDVLVFGDNDGTCVTINQRYSDKAGMVGGDEDFANRWGLTFVAKGTSLAAADLFATGSGGDGWQQPFRWTVREDGPDGAIVGESRLNVGAWFGPGTGLYGVSWNPGEIPLVPGETYFLEIEGRAGPNDLQTVAGFTPYFMRLDSVDDSRSFKNDDQQPEDVDLNVTLMQYTDNTCTDPVAPECTGPDCADAGPDIGGADAGVGQPPVSSGCGCRSSSGSGLDSSLVGLAMLVGLGRRRRRRSGGP